MHSYYRNLDSWKPAGYRRDLRCFLRLGGSLAWKTTSSTVVTAAGATDIPGSGIASYQYRTSADGGTTWNAPITGTSANITAQGQTLLQFRAVDASGTVSNCSGELIRGVGTSTCT